MIKALMVVVAVLLRKALRGVKIPVLLQNLLSAICAEAVMIVGYYGYESVFVLSSFRAVLVNIPFNLIRAAFAIILGCLVIGLVDRFLKER